MKITHIIEASENNLLEQIDHSKLDLLQNHHHCNWL